MSDERKMDQLQNMYHHSEACGCFVALDFETVSGLQVDGKTYHHLPLSVGMFKVRNCQEAIRYSSLMRPPVSDGVKYACYVDRSLNQDTLRDAPSYEEVYRRMAEFCADADYLVCHNHTEGHVLKELAELYGYAIDKPIRDTLQILVRHGETDNSLTASCLRHGVHRVGKDHDALSDAEACAALYLQLLKSGIVEETAQRAPAPSHRSHRSGEAGDTSAYRHQVDESEKISGSRFDGVSVVITGMAYDERDKLYRYLHQRGASIKNSVSGRVDWLVLGPNGAGSTGKVNRARELGVHIMQLDELLRMIEEDSQRSIDDINP